jgi:hypothetical protein
MTKLSHNDILDAALNEIATANLMTVCSQPPTTRTEAVTTYALADVAMAGGDYTNADGDASGRKVTVGAKAGVNVDVSGMANHVALVDGSVLLYVTEMGTVNGGTAQAGAATTITLAAGASAVDDEYNNMAITIDSGTGSGQTAIISDYVGSTKVATVPTWGTNPDATSVYRVYGMQLTSGNTIDYPAWDIEFADPV